MYGQAGEKSGKFQRLFLLWNGLNFACLILGALAIALKEWISGAAFISAVLLAAGAAITFWLRNKHYEQAWYRCRAIAESVKTLSWRYIMCAAPYVASLDPDDAAGRLNLVLHDMAKEERELPAPEPNEVTEKMRQVRTWPVDDRLATYLEYRIKDQRVWYAGKSRDNSEAAKRYLFLAAGTQIAAVVFAFTKVPDSVVGVFSSLAACLLAWIQLKSYEDLSQAYLTASKELSRIEGNPPRQVTDEDLSQFVIDSENAISREHTLWVAKRS